MTESVKFHPLADVFPLMEGEEFDALVADIKANGLREKIDLYEGKIVDGRKRYLALQRLGIDPSADPNKYFRKAIYAHTIGGEIAPHERGNDDRVRAYVISKNIHRRHLTAEQKRDLIAKLVKAQPEKSDRQIAKTAKVDHKTVAGVRSEIEGRGEIPHVETRTDTKGRKQPAKKGWSRERWKAHRVRKRIRTSSSTTRSIWWRGWTGDSGRSFSTSWCRSTAGRWSRRLWLPKWRPTSRSHPPRSTTAFPSSCAARRRSSHDRNIAQESRRITSQAGSSFDADAQC
jgi:hypothetical protein